MSHNPIFHSTTNVMISHAKPFLHFWLCSNHFRYNGTSTNFDFDANGLAVLENSENHLNFSSTVYQCRNMSYNYFRFRIAIFLLLVK